MHFRCVATLMAAIVLAGCAQPHVIQDRSDFLAEATRTYQGETRERVIQAAQTVLKISDPTDFEFRNTLNGFTGLRRYFIYAVLASATGREKWEFQAEPSPAGIHASVSISEAGQSHGGYTSTPYENVMASIPLVRLFWARVDYVLGKAPEWRTCGEAAEELEKTKTNIAEALGGLCGTTSEGRDAPPPARLPPLPKPVAVVKPKPHR